jgi:hypothetical protein
MKTSGSLRFFKQPELMVFYSEILKKLELVVL